MDLDPNSHIIIIEDNPLGARALDIILRKHYHSTKLYSNATEALEAYSKKPKNYFDCVISSYQLSDMTGLEALQLFKQKDPSISLVFVTAKEEAALIQQSFRDGAIDYLVKPVSSVSLQNTTLKAIKETRKRRKVHETVSSMQDAKKINAAFSITENHEIETYSSISFHPRHEVGGDFIDILNTDNNTSTMLIGDVSGHSIKSTLIASYFQGFLKASLSHGAEINHVFDQFNELLSSEWESSLSSIPNSLSACAITIGSSGNKASITQCGFPDILLIQSDGRVQKIRSSYPPIGWFNHQTFETQTHDIEGVSLLYAFTDGLEDHAEDMGMNLGALAFKLNQKDENDKKEEILSSSRDDILLLKLQIDRHTKKEGLPELIVFQCYEEPELSKIDIHQKIWKRSLLFCFPEIEDILMHDILVCCREALINALKYGCSADHESECCLQITYLRSENKLKIWVEDGGIGHTIRPGKNINILSQESPKISLGLEMIHRLSNNIKYNNNGASIYFDFILDISV